MHFALLNGIIVIKKRGVVMEQKILPHDHGNISKGLQRDIPSERAFEIIADVFKVMSDTKRVELFWILCHCEECVVNLSALMDMSSSAVSHHLKILKTTGFVVSRREGKEVYYTVSSAEKSKVLHEMTERISELSCPKETPSVDIHGYGDNVHIIKEIHEMLIKDLQRRYTVEELSQMYSINQTTLKTTFKSCYGQPIATYLKEYRIKRACELLSKTPLPISEIASKVGYENQSKFTQAFKMTVGVLPRDYRKQSGAISK